MEGGWWPLGRVGGTPPGVLRGKMIEYYIDENFKELQSKIVFHIFIPFCLKMTSFDIFTSKQKILKVTPLGVG